MRYVEAFPEDIDAAWARDACAILPIGALEWHGAHLPLGLDGIVAEWFAAQLAERIDGVLLPALYTPITTLPHRHSLRISTDAFRLLLDETVASLYRSGARRIALVTGHYAQGHMVELFEVALRAMEDFDGLRVFVGTPLEVLDKDELLDHAARFETSQLLALRPDLVRLQNLPQSISAKADAVLGQDPRLGSAEEGKKLLEEALQGWASALDLPAETLRSALAARFDAYQGYIDQYFEGSWDDAIVKWWESKK
jgi:creatinine amidohydrolase